MQLTFGNVTLREVEIDYVPSPSPKGRVKVKKHFALSLDVTTPCGERWLNYATIHDPESKNPGLEITSKTSTMGVQGIQRILILLEEWRVRKGLDFSMSRQVLDNYSTGEAEEYEGLG